MLCGHTFTQGRERHSRIRFYRAVVGVYSATPNWTKSKATPRDWLSHELNAKEELCLLPKLCISVFRMILTINSNCYPNSINRLDFVMDT
jgi:hypothetical protein